MISKQILDFLDLLAQNNNRPWFEAHKTTFKELESMFKNEVGEITELLNQFDEIERAKVYRIYRDIRFSKDKTPFKIHRSAHWVRAGVQRRGGYFMKIRPENQSLIGVGFFGPNKEDLLRIRKEFEIDGASFKETIGKSSFQAEWGDLQGERLKTAPRNFDKDHEHIDIIRYKSFYFQKHFTDQEVLEPEFNQRVADSFKAAQPFLDYMTDVLTTDLNGVSLL